MFVMILFTTSHAFHDKQATAARNTNELDVIFCSTIIPNTAKEATSVSLVHNISPEAMSHLTTWHPTHRHIHFSIFHLGCWWPRCTVPLHCEHRFPGLNWNDNTQLEKTRSSTRALQRWWGASYEQRARHCHLSSRSSNDGPQLLPSTQNTDHSEGEQSGLWCAAYVGFLQAWTASQSVTLTGLMIAPLTGSVTINTGSFVHSHSLFQQDDSEWSLGESLQSSDGDVWEH